jgi:hypothetical protein
MDHIKTTEEADLVAGHGTELAHMMHAVLNPKPAETWQEREARQEQEDFAKATKIDAKDYSGWVSWPRVWPKEEGFFESVDDLIRYCADHELNSPTFVWACTPDPLKLDADWILDQALEEHHDGARGEISASEEKRLQAFLDVWAAAQNIVSWHEDRTRAVMMPPGDEDAANG